MDEELPLVSVLSDQRISRTVQDKTADDKSSCGSTRLENAEVVSDVPTRCHHPDLDLSESDKSIYRAVDGEESVESITELISVMGSLGTSALCIASEEGNLESIKLLLGKGANAESYDRNGWKPIHHAVICGQCECVEVLLDKDKLWYDPTHDNTGFNVFHLAAIKGNSTVMLLLIVRYEQDQNKRLYKYDCIDDYESYPINAEDKFGRSPLYYAAFCNNIKCVETMVIKGYANLCRGPKSLKKSTSPLQTIDQHMFEPTLFLRNILDTYIQSKHSWKAMSTYSPDHALSHVFNISFSLFYRGSFRESYTFFDFLLKCDHVDYHELFLHPVVETYLHLKWGQLKHFYYMFLTTYMMFTIMLTTVATSSMIFMSTDTSENGFNSSSEHGNTSMFVQDLSKHSNTFSTCGQVLFGISYILLFIQVVLLAFGMKEQDLKSTETWARWAVCVISPVTLIDPEGRPLVTQASAVAVLLAWMTLAFMLARSPTKYGTYILIVSTVCKRMCQVILHFALIYVGFGFFFSICFQSQKPFGNPLLAIYKVFMMTTEIEYFSFVESDVEEASATSLLGRAGLAFFVMFVALAFTNVLTALAVKDVNEMKVEGRTLQVEKRIELMRSIHDCLWKLLSSKDELHTRSKYFQKYFESYLNYDRTLKKIGYTFVIENCVLNTDELPHELRKSLIKYCLRLEKQRENTHTHPRTENSKLE